MTVVFNGALAQLGERLICIQEVIGSIPIGSTNQRFACKSAEVRESALLAKRVRHSYQNRDLHDHQAHLVCLIILQGMSSVLRNGTRREFLQNSGQLTSFIEINISIVWQSRVWDVPEVQGVSCLQGTSYLKG